MTQNDSHQYPEVTVGAMIFDREGRLFLMKSHKWTDMYCLPGGHIEIGETAEAAAIREVKEETNMEITDIRFLAVTDAVFASNFHERKHFVFLEFTCTAVTTDVILNDEAEEYAWVRPEELGRFPVETYTKKTIDYYFHPVGDAYIRNPEDI